MKVKCVRLNPVIEPGDQSPIHGELSPDQLTVGRCYVVYAIEVRDGRAILWIDSDYRLQWPSPVDASLFVVEAGAVSRLWVVTFTPHLWIAPRPCIESEFFFDRLTDGDSEAVAAFSKMKEFMDLEFTDQTVEATARVIDDAWLQCPNCQDAWESQHDSALVRCTSCQAILRNPRIE
ncbi:MAG: hypothetical protein IT464_03340 [Planctomycetes bacterium]|nr:hypothetical protein [Planctomycetota bacterium]